MSKRKFKQPSHQRRYTNGKQTWKTLSGGESGGEHEFLHLLYSPNKNTTTYIQSNRTSHSGPEGMQNAAATLKDRLVISYETMHTLITWSNNHTIFTQTNWKFMSLNKTVVLTSFIIVQTWKQSRCPSTGKGRNTFWYSAMRPNSYQDMEESEMYVTKWHVAI